jgi:glyoxylase-like metal-dependent hydrolase (beta-lactamase superfamily II)
VLALVAALVLLCSPLAASAQGARAALERASRERVDKRVLTDGARAVEIHHMAGNTHADGLLLVYLPKERLLIQADAFTPGPPNAPTPAIINPLSVDLAGQITRLGLSVDRLLPLHGRMVPLADLQRVIGRGN